MVARNWNVVRQKNDENIMYWKEEKLRSSWNDQYKRFLLKTIRKRQLQIFLDINYKQSWWTREANIKWRDVWYQKQRKATHKIHRQSE